jgi:hypothetical protein
MHSRHGPWNVSEIAPGSQQVDKHHEAVMVGGCNPSLLSLPHCGYLCHKAGNGVVQSAARSANPSPPANLRMPRSTHLRIDMQLRQLDVSPRDARRR